MNARSSLLGRGNLLGLVALALLILVVFPLALEVFMVKVSG